MRNIYKKMRSLLKPIYIPLRNYIYKRFPITRPNYVATQGPLTWDFHGCAARTSIGWYDYPKFRETMYSIWSDIEKLNLSYTKRGITYPIKRERFRNEWNLHIASWAARHAVKLKGDFIECGVGFGIFPRFIMEYLNFNQYTDKTYYLMDRRSNDQVDFMRSGGR